MKTTGLLLVISLCGALFGSCGSNKQQTAEETMIDRIENFSVKVPESSVQVYENSDCRAMTATIDGVECMVAYSAPLHCIDIVSLDSISSYQQIKLEGEGPNGVNQVSGIFYYDNSFILKCATGFCRINRKGEVVSKWWMFDYLDNNSGWGLRFPEQTMVFNLYRHLGFDEVNGLVALPLYKHKKENGQYPTRILILSCNDWKIVDEVDVNYPEQMKQEKWLGCLGEVQALPHGEKLIYNFPASSDIFVYDRKNKTTEVYSIPTQYTESYYRCVDEQDTGLKDGYFMPIRYDRHRNNFWRVQQKKIIGTGVAGKPFSVTRLSADFDVINEYDTPERKEISSFSILFLSDKVLFPYLGGEYIGLDNIVFYGIKL